DAQAGASPPGRPESSYFQETSMTYSSTSSSGPIHQLLTETGRPPALSCKPGEKVGDHREDKESETNRGEAERGGSVSARRGRAGPIDLVGGRPPRPRPEPGHCGSSLEEAAGWASRWWRGR